jgi:CRP-like cAMP-binding protein
MQSSRTHIVPAADTPTLRKTRLFSELPVTARREILEHCCIRKYAAHRQIVCQGEVPAFIHVLLAGQLRVYLGDASGDEITIRLLSSGKSCMDETVMADGRSPVCVDTITKAQLLQIPAHFARNFGNECPQFAHIMLKIAAENQTLAISQIDMMALKTPLQRVCRYLLLEQMAQGPDKCVIDLRFRKSVIANHLGIAPETLSRTFRKIRRFGITVIGQKVHLETGTTLCRICDHDAVVACVEECSKISASSHMNHTEDTTARPH